jgi:hypothetical protein
MTSDSIIAWCLRMSENILLLALRTAPNRGGVVNFVIHFYTFPAPSQLVNPLPFWTPVIVRCADRAFLSAA